MPHAHPVSSTRRVPGLLWLASCVLIGAGAVLLFGPGPVQAEDSLPTTQFLSITGEGPTAKAWYEGAQPSGVKLQQALESFNKKGYRVKAVTEPHPAAGSGYVWNILLER